MYKNLLVIIAFAVSFNLTAQIKTTIFPDGNAFKEFPMLNKINKEEIPLYIMPFFNLDSILQEEKELDEKGVGRPFRFGYAFDVDYGMEHGKWLELEDKNIWSIRFKSNGAYTINFEFTDLKLNNKSELYVYNSVGTVIDGPITSKDNATERFRHIGSDLIAGDEAIIQIIKPKSLRQTSILKISKVVHGFRNHYREILPSNEKVGDNFQALDCYYDAMCLIPYGPIFENESRGVAMLMVGNSGFCSGALLNNQLGTNRPYFLTAFHCADADNNGMLSNSEKNTAESWSFQFGYKKTTCNGSSTVFIDKYYFANFRAAFWETDFLLLELKDAVTDPDVRFLGWDALPAIPPGAYPLPPFASPITMGVCLHHPAGNPMKISVDNSVIDFFRFPIPWTDGPTSPSTTHYDVYFDISTVERGSSGAPLFDQNKRVRGQLHGGFNISCIANMKFFGALEISMLGGGTTETSLYNWLVPYPTGTATNDFRTNTIVPCQSIVWNRNVTKDERIVCKVINVNNVSISSGATLKLEATEKITIGTNVTVQAGAKLELIGGTVSIDYGTFKVMEGASLIIK